MSCEVESWSSQYSLRRSSMKTPTLPRQIFPRVDAELVQVWEALEKVRDGYQVIEENLNEVENSVAAFMTNTSSDLETFNGTLKKFDEQLKTFAKNQVQFRLDL